MAGNEIKRMLPRHQKILELSLEGHSQVDIAAMTGMTTIGIGLIQRSPVFQDEIARRRDRITREHDGAVGVHVTRAMDKLQQAAEEAAEVHVNLLNSEDERVAQKSASEILDRVGLGRSEKTGDTKVTVINAETMNLLQVALTEAT